MKFKPPDKEYAFLMKYYYAAVFVLIFIVVGCLIGGAFTGVLFKKKKYSFHKTSSVQEKIVDPLPAPTTIA